jgi:cell division protein FtsW
MSNQFSTEQNGQVRKTDHILVASILFLTGLGLVTLYSASYSFAQRFFNNGRYFISKQLLWSAFGIVAFFIASIVSLEWLRKLIILFVFGALALCALTLVPGIGLIKNGAARWIGIGPFSFQPSELAKLVLPLYLAHFYEKRKTGLDSDSPGILRPTMICALFLGIIYLQNDYSTVIFLALNIMTMFFLAGVKFRYLFSLLFMFLPIAVFWVLTKETRLRRIIGFIQPDFEPRNANYQVIFSRNSITSGGFWGKGIGQGTRKLASVPEVHSDFIFSSYAEESGFLGVILFCALFAVFAIRGYMVSMRNEDTFNRLLGCGLVTIIISQALLNVAVAAGALPATGVPLPFFSAGGSSLLITLIMAGLIVNVSRTSKGMV